MKQALIVFVKEPVPGKVKTRLANGKLTLEHTSNIYTAFLKDSYHRYKTIENTDIIYYYAGNLDPLKKILPDQKNWHIQSNSDLGEKMFNSFNQVLVNYNKCVIVGSDHPDLPLTYLKKAFNVLNYVDVSIGKSDDGGYYCIGMKKADLELFNNMTWSVDTVYKETIERLKDKDLEYFELPEWYDIDTIDDLKRFIRTNNLSEYPHLNDYFNKIDLDI